MTTELILLHGFLGQRSDWDAVQTGLVIPAMAPDLFDGNSDLIAQPGDFETLCHALFVRLNEKLQFPDKFALCGYSLGGRIALAWAKLFPKRISQLILVSAHPGLPEEQRLDRELADNVWSDRLRRGLSPEVLRQWYNQPVFDSLSPTKKEQLIAQRLTGPHRPWHQWLIGLSLCKQPDYTGLLSGTTIPVNYIAGRQDIKFMTIGNALHTENSNIQLYTVSGCGHNIHQEQPGSLSRLLNKLLTNVNE